MSLLEEANKILLIVKSQLAKCDCGKLATISAESLYCEPCWQIETGAGSRW